MSADGALNNSGGFKPVISRLGALALLASSPLLCSPAAAQSLDVSALSLEELLQVEVVSASKFAQKANEAPSAVRVIEAADIRHHGWRTLGEALASLPGLFTSFDRAYTYLGARGLLIPGDYNTRFLLLVDGEPLNDSVYEQAVLGDEFPLDLELVARIEYVPGPGSSIYGANAMFGVVNVITRTAEALGRGQVAGRVDSEGRRGLRAHLTQALGEHGRLTLAASRIYEGGQDVRYPDAVGLQTADGTPSSDGVAHDLDRSSSNRLFARLEQGEFSLSLIAAERERQPSSALYGTLFDDPGFRIEDAYLVLAGRYATQLAEGIDFSGRLSFARVRYDGQYPFWDDDSDQRYLNTDYGVSRRLAGEARLFLSRWQGHKLVVGMDFRHDLQLEQGLADVGVTVNEPFTVKSPDTRWGVYAQDEWQFAPDWRLNAGLRYDHSDIRGGNISPRLGLLWQARPDLALKLLAGRAYRAPNAYEADYGYAAAPADSELYLRNPDMEPELVTTYEAVAEWRPAPRTELAASLYAYSLKDLVGQAVVSGNYQYQNLYDIKARGLELSLRQQFGGGVRLDASLALQRAELDGNGDMSNTPPWLAKLALVGPVWGDVLQGALEVQAIGPRDYVWYATDYHASVLPLVNLSLTTARLAPGLEAQLRVTNLLDRDYFEPAGEEAPVPRIPGVGRTVGLTLSYAF